MRLLGIELRVDTTLVLCVSIGGLFNTTIHYSARVLQQIAQGERDPDQILLHAMRTVGPSALFTAVALSVGFAVFTLSSFYGLQAMGLLSMVTLMTGFFSDMIVTTVIMRVAFGWKSALRERAAPTIVTPPLTLN
jgi:predicted RND superfamily exporter protein